MAHGKELLLLLSLTMELLADLSRSGQVCRVVAAAVAVIHPGGTEYCDPAMELRWPGWPGRPAELELHPDGARPARNAAT